MDALIVTLGDQISVLEAGQSGTIRCAGKQMTANFAVEFNTVGSFTYNGVKTTGRPGSKSGLKCAGQMMATDIVITAGEEESGGESGFTPKGTTTINSNGEHDVYLYEKAVVDVPIPLPKLQAKEHLFEKNGVGLKITPDEGYDGLSEVAVSVLIPESEGGSGGESVPVWDGSFTITREIKGLKNETLTVEKGWTAKGGTGQFAVDCVYNGYKYNRLDLGYGWEASLKMPFPFNNFILLSNDGSAADYCQVTTSMTFTILITGGKDVENETLLAWFKEFGAIIVHNSGSNG